MKSTFHEVELGRAVIQNATGRGTEQLIVSLPTEGRSSIDIQIKENTNESSSTTGSISISENGLQKLFHWLREEGVVS
jgi:4-hydroxy-3-methylbut-2-en-1-yl diphosphate synthase IspG/GcpE